MRSTILVGLLPLFAVTTLGCSDANSGELTGGHGSGRSSAAAATDGSHDDEPTVGENANDTGNPNANTKPGAPGTAGTNAAQFALALSSTTPTLGLGESMEIDVTVQPQNGWMGDVQLSVTGLPDGATATPVTARPGTPAKLVIATAFNAVATPPNGSSPVVITGTSAAKQATANANFKVAPKMTLTIPMNIDALRAAGTTFRDEWGAPFGANQQALRTQTGNGIVVSVFNADSKAHIIHGSNGFAHGNTNAPIEPNAFELANGSPRTRTLNPGTNGTGYPHDGSNGAGASFHIKVDAAQ